MTAQAGWAKHYVSRGWKLIPLHVLINGLCSCGRGRECSDNGNAGKHPVPRDWNNPLNAIQSDLQCERQWGDGVALQYSMGLLCGTPSKVWVLDIDPRNGGYDSLESWEAEYGILPDTLRARTGGGGMHIFFALPAGMVLKKGPLHKDYPGIDVQAENSQIVLAPSVHYSGNRYTWETPLDTPLAEAPAALVEMIRGDRGSTAGSGAGGAGVDIDKLMAGGGIASGERNNTMYKVACKYARQFGVETDEQKRLVIGAVRTFNSEFVKPPLELDELLTLTRSALDFIGANPSTKDIDPAMAEWIAAQRAKQERDAGPSANANGAAEPAATGGASDGEGGLSGDGDRGAAGHEGEPAAATGATAENSDEDHGAGPNIGDSGESAGMESRPVAGVEELGGPGESDEPSGPPAPLDPDDPNAGGGSDDGGPGNPIAPDPDSLGDDGVIGGRSETDNGNARRIVDYHGHNLRYTPTAGWYYWDGTTWRYDQDQLQITEHARTMPAHIAAEILNMPLAQASTSTLLDWALKSKDAGRIRKTVALANTDRRVYLNHSKWDSNKDWLGVKNGVVDLRTGDLMAPDRTQFITKRANVEYDPRRRDTRFAIWLDQVTGGDKEFAAWLQRVVGYTLTGETSEEKFFLIYGPPGSGKSTILEIIHAMLGEYAYSLAAENIMAQKHQSGADSYFIAELHGRRMVGVSELPEAELMKEDAIKRLTGGDTLVGRRVQQQPFTFQSQAKLWVATNHRPRVNDPGIWRRMKAVPFEYKPAVIDSSLKPYLKSAEGGLPGVLAWAVEGARQWYATAGKVGGGIGSCSVVDAATNEYKENEDEIGQFLAEEMRMGDGLQVALPEVFAVYERWMDDRGFANAKITRLHRDLRARGNVEIEGTGRRAVVKGWALQPRLAQAPSDGAWGDMMGRARL